MPAADPQRSRPLQPPARGKKRNPMKTKQTKKTDTKAPATTAAKLKDLPAKKDPKAGRRQEQGDK